MQPADGFVHSRHAGNNAPRKRSNCMSDAKNSPDTLKTTATAKLHEAASREHQAARQAAAQGAAFDQQATEDFREVRETVADTMVRTTAAGDAPAASDASAVGARGAAIVPRVAWRAFLSDPPRPPGEPPEPDDPNAPPPIQEPPPPIPVPPDPQPPPVRAAA
jgi:hypothetical protein